MAEEGNFLILQVCLATVMLAVTAVAGTAPLCMMSVMKKKGKDATNSGWMSYLSCFSGGVFMATCFLDVVPHIFENYEELLTNYKLDISFPVHTTIICCGFFLVYFIEEITMLVMGGAGHGHSHEHLEKQERVTNLAVEETSPWVVSDEKSNVLKSITFAIAMSFHSLLEGFALGVQETTTGIYALFFSLLLHKSIESFSVGLQISKANSEKVKIVVVTILIYSLMTPAGSVLGTLLKSSNFNSFYKDGSTLLLEALAAGTFIYVTFIEVLAVEKENRFNSMKQLVCIIAGFLLITALQLLFGHSHDGGAVHAQSATNNTLV